MKAPTVSESITNSSTILPASRIRTTSSERVWIEQARYSSRPRAHPRRSGYAHLRAPHCRRPPRLAVSPRLQSTEEGRGAARGPGLFNRIHRSAWKVNSANFGFTEFCEVLAHKNLGCDPLADGPGAHDLVVRGPRLPHTLGPHAGDLSVLIGVLGL